MIKMLKYNTKTYLLTLVLLIFTGCEPQQSIENDIDHHFTIAVIPDTQNYVDYTHQKEKDFAVDGAGMFIEHMQYISDNTVSRGGDITFVTSVGDVWQHRLIGVDPAHYDRGMRPLNDYPKPNVERVAGIYEFEIPLAKRGYDLLADTGVIFSVVPGNHDYNWYWRDKAFARDLSRRAELLDENGRFVRFDPEILGMTHVGGLDNFNSVFGADSDYFKNKNWYINSFHGGANSAQIFKAGGYKFLHLGFEMQAGDQVLAWAQSVIDANPGLPTIMSTHDFLTTEGTREVRAIADYARSDPTQHNNTEEIWRDFISKNDQIFMVLSGHNRAQSFRDDENDMGHRVYQMLSDYQDRGHSANLDTDTWPPGIGDGWLRLLKFDTSLDVPIIEVQTYSTYYKKYSSDVTDYAKWYKKWEHPKTTDDEFNAMDHFTIELTDFKTRFGEPK